MSFLQVLWSYFLSFESWNMNLCFIGKAFDCKILGKLHLKDDFYWKTDLLWSFALGFELKLACRANTNGWNQS